MKKQRKERTDKGKTRISERDVIMLKWIAEQYAIRIDHLQVLGGRLSQRNKVQKPLAQMTAYHLVKRWINAGWAKGQIIISGRPMWVWPTNAGLDFADGKYPYYQPKVSRLEHLQAVNHVRLWLEDRLQSDVNEPKQSFNWSSERAINRDWRFRGKQHLVDGELVLNGDTIGIEVELHLKSKNRYRYIFKELQEKYRDIWYFANSAIAPDLRKLIGEADPNQETFTIYRLDEAYNIAEKMF